MRRSSPRSTRLLALGLAVLLSLVTACGGDDDSSDDSSSDSEQTTTAPDSGDDESSQTTAADSGSDDPIAAVIEAQAEELGIEDAVEDGDDFILKMKDGSDAAAVAAACAFGYTLKPDASISTEVDGETTACPSP